MTLQTLASALRSRHKSAEIKGKTGSEMPDEKLVGLHTKCPQCGKALFMDDGLIVDQSTSVERFLERCAKRLAEHRCNSGSAPQH